jgi:hypothetical protein
MSDYSDGAPPADDHGKRGRDRIRMMSRWRASQHIVETEQGELHVATTSAGVLAEHIAEMHNRTLGDGQDPPVPHPAERRREYEGTWPPPMPDYLDNPQAVNRSLRAHPDTAAFLAHLNTARPLRVDDLRLPLKLDDERRQAPRPVGYLEAVRMIVDDEVRRRVIEYAAREPARIVIDGSVNTMAWTLRQLGWSVTEPGQPAPEAQPAPVVELAHTEADNGVKLLVDGVVVASANAGDEGGGGVAWATRGLCRALGVPIIDFEEGTT